MKIYSLYILLKNKLFYTYNIILRVQSWSYLDHCKQCSFAMDLKQDLLM